MSEDSLVCSSGISPFKSKLCAPLCNPSAESFEGIRKLPNIVLLLSFCAFLSTVFFSFRGSGDGGPGDRDLWNTGKCDLRFSALESSSV